MALAPLEAGYRGLPECIGLTSISGEPNIAISEGTSPFVVQASAIGFRPNEGYTGRIYMDEEYRWDFGDEESLDVLE